MFTKRYPTPTKGSASRKRTQLGIGTVQVSNASLSFEGAYRDVNRTFLFAASEIAKMDAREVGQRKDGDMENLAGANAAKVTNSGLVELNITYHNIHHSIR